MLHLAPNIWKFHSAKCSKQKMIQQKFNRIAEQEIQNAMKVLN